MFNGLNIFFSWQSNCADMKFNMTDDHPAETKNASFVDVDFSKLEAELREYVIKQEVCVYVCMRACVRACVCVCSRFVCGKALKRSFLGLHSVRLNDLFWLCCMYLTLLMGSFAVGPTETALPWISGLPWPAPSTVPGSYAHTHKHTHTLDKFLLSLK